MSSGFENFSLVLFTTLTPAGIIAFVCVSIPLIFLTLDAKERVSLNRYLALPYAIALVGFIASATHLGTPSNALHVFSGIGHSPLSNEVLCAVIFLALAGAYWMFSFREHFPVALSRVWLGLSCVAGIALVAMTSLAYSVDTVLTWSSWLTPVNLFFSALLAGPVIAVLTYACAGLELRRLSLACTLLALVALVLGTVFLVIHENSLAAITNYEFSAADLLPTYTTTIVVHVISGGLGVALAFSSLRQRLSRNNRLLLLVCSCLCLLIAVFLPRVAFYALHMTAGF